MKPWSAPKAANSNVVRVQDTYDLCGKAAAQARAWAALSPQSEQVTEYLRMAELWDEMGKAMDLIGDLSTALNQAP